MANGYRPEYVYEPMTTSDLLKEKSMLFMMFLLACGVIFVITTFLLLMIPRGMPFIWWPTYIARLTSKVCSIVGWPLWLLLEIIGFIMSRAELRKSREP